LPATLIFSRSLPLILRFQLAFAMLIAAMLSPLAGRIAHFFIDASFSFSR